ncbi:glycosyl hydrolase family 28-related protein [Nevskia ramosa]|uniref:glycosyl hydrolase family 28-related protein n=1 Tax=Nevskia ramosa TaxID=64002 RepID=UPI0003B5E583|nr:glycosyl hydrolase family 28-related protein [Nevskia ramosa]
MSDHALWDRRQFLFAAGMAAPALARAAGKRDRAEAEEPVDEGDADGSDDSVETSNALPQKSVRGYGLSLDDFDADPTGVKDSTRALQTAVDRAAGGCLLIPRGRYRISRPIAIEKSGLAIIGESLRSESLLGSVLFKSDDFKGDALLHAIRDDKVRVHGLSISGITVDGRRQPGSGFRFVNVGNVTLESVVVSGCSDWGVEIDGGFLCSLRGVIAIGNGSFDKGKASGGGVLLAANSRACADARIIDSCFNKNLGAQLRLAGRVDGTSTGPRDRRRVAGLTVLGCQFERPAHDDLRVPVVAVDAAERCSFISCNFVQPRGMNPPCLGLGGAGGWLSDVSFIACYFQYNGKQGAAIRAEAGTRNISFIDARHGGRGRLFDFAATLDPGSIFFNRPPDLARGSGRAALSFPLMAPAVAAGG